MNDNDNKKVDEIMACLERHYPDTEIVQGRQQGRLLSSFHIRISSGVQYILKVTDECVMDNSLSALLQTVSSECLAAMTENPNQEVVLFKDLHLEVGEPH